MDVDWLGLYLLEDLGPGDVTSDALVAADAQGEARIVARERLLVAGLEHAAQVFERLGARLEVTVMEGTWVRPKTVLARVTGPTRAILAGERVALNIIGRMAGVASLTRELTDRLVAAAATARVAGTRKTTPGFRRFEKQAIAIGGGDPHRAGLWDEAMVKDNHREALEGGVAAAVRTLKAAAPNVTVTCEVESEPDAIAAAAAGADWVLIDNQEPAVGRAWAARTRAARPGVRIEASGGIKPETLVEYGWADRISLGWLTQRAPARDVSLEWGA